MTGLTPAQEEVFKKVQELLSEHFDSWTLAIETDLDESDEDGQLCDFWQGSFGGGLSRAKGLTLSHLDCLRNRHGKAPDA